MRYAENKIYFYGCKNNHWKTVEMNEDKLYVEEMYEEKTSRIKRKISYSVFLFLSFAV